MEKRPKPNECKDIAVQKIMKILKQTDTGDILVFIKASGDGKLLCQLLMQNVKKIKSNDINPFCVILAGNSNKEDEHLATDESQYLSLLDNQGKQYTRKVVMATNVAESSLTVDGVVFVIDCGLEYEESYDPNTMSRCLSEEFVAESGMKQRRGRGGRTQPGVCFHLYTKEQARQFQKYPTPSIQKSDLTSDMLDLMKLDYINDIKQLKQFLNEFISPPKDIFIESGLNTLMALGAFTSKGNSGVITDLGYAISKFRAIKPHLAKSLIASYFYKCSKSVCDVICLFIACDGMISNLFIEYRDNKKKPFKYNQNQRQLYNKSRDMLKDNRGDIMTLLKTFRLFKEKKNLLKEIRIVEEDFKDVNQKSMMQLLNKSSKRSINQSSSKKSQKSLKLMKMLKVSNDIIKESQKKNKLDEDEHLKSLSKNSKKNNKTDKKENNKIQKWCSNNYVNYKKLKRADEMSKQLHRTLKEIVRKHNLIPRKKTYISARKSKTLSENDESTMDEDYFEPSNQEGGRPLPLNKYYEDDEEINKLEEDDRILYALMEGMFVNVAVKRDNKYKPCFPSVKVNSNINRESFIKNPSKIVIYDELFMFNKNSSMLKLNIVNSIPEKMVSSLNKKYNKYMKACFNIKKSKKKRSLKRGKRRLKTFKRKKKRY